MSEKKLKLFVSSPGDLVPERQAVQRVVARINGDYLGVVHFEVIRWEEKSYSARRVSEPNRRGNELRLGDRDAVSAHGYTVAG